MNFEFLKEAVSSPWQIEPSTLNAIIPLFRGLLSGLTLEKSSEPAASLPYIVSPVSRSVTMAYPSTDQAELQETTQPSIKVIHILPVRSVLTKHDQDCGPSGTRTLACRLLRADADENILGHILVIESGGGQSTAVPELADAIGQCTKPVVAWIDGIAASAAYYIASYCNQIIASRPMDVVGCIGTMAMYEGRKSKSPENSLGEVSVTIYADGSGQKNEEFEKAINEFDFKLIKERILNPVNEKFKSDILSNRPTILQEQLQGRTYFASEVVGSLIDAIGSLDTAIDRIEELSGFRPEIQSSLTQPSINTIQEMKQFPHLNNALAVDFLESTEDGVFLNETQLRSLEDLLEQNLQLATERDNSSRDLSAANSALATASAALTSAYDGFNEIDPSVASAVTAETKAAALRALLAARPSATPVQLLNEDDHTVSPEVDWELINNLSHNKILDLTT